MSRGRTGKAPRARGRRACWLVRRSWWGLVRTTVKGGLRRQGSARATSYCAGLNAAIDKATWLLSG